MMQKILTKRDLFKEQGISMIEFAIILPLLALLFIGIFEIGLALNTYLTLTQITREGVRFGSRTPFLKFGVEENNLTCSSECGGHKKVHDNILKLIKDNGIDKRFYTSSTPSITTFLEKKDEGKFRVTIKIPYKGWLLMKGFYITTEDKGPYLFPN